MAKFFNILAASVGSGLVLGASIQLGEALAGKLKAATPEPAANGTRPLRPSPPAERHNTDTVSPAFLSRLDQLEEKMSRTHTPVEAPSAVNAPAPEWQSIIADVVARMDRQQSDVEPIRQQVSKATRTLDSVGDIASHLRSDLQNELGRNLDERLAAIEARVHLKMEAAHGETLEAMVSALETRVTPRIVRIESQIAGQTSAVSELRECALQSERSVQRLLGVLERMVNPGQTDSISPRQGGTPDGGHEQRTSAASPTGSSTGMPPSFAVLNPIY